MDFISEIKHFCKQSIFHERALSEIAGMAVSTFHHIINAEYNHECDFQKGKLESFYINFVVPFSELSEQIKNSESFERIELHKKRSILINYKYRRTPKS